MKIVFFGTPHFVIPILGALQKNIDLVGVVTTPDAPLGRKKILTPTPVKLTYQNYLQRTKKTGLIIDSQQFNNKTIKQLSDVRPDLFVVAAYGHLVPESVLNIPKHGALNIHPSLLPKYRGPSPIQTAILNGETTSGITIIKMDEKLDHGPIVAQKEIPVSDNDTFETLHVKMFAEAANMLPGVIDDFVSGKQKSQPQDEADATYCEHITKQDGYFDIENSPGKEKLDRMIRAYYPWPTAWTRIRIMNNESKIMKLLPGKRIQLEGGKPMTEKEFVNGYPEARQLLAQLFAR